MFKLPILASLAGTITLGCAAATAAVPDVTAVQEQAVPAAPADAVAHSIPGEATTARLCSQCHSLASATQRTHTRDEWNGIIGRMIEQGLVASNEELFEVSDYLTANYGPPAS